MPHFIVSYARPLGDKVVISSLCETVYATANDSGLFRPEAIKVRALPVDDYVVGVKGKADFLHIEARMFAGRTDVQKQALLSALMDAITPIIGDTPALSIEAVDMVKETYLKRD